MRRRSRKLVSWSQTLTYVRARELEQPPRFKVQLGTHAHCRSRLPEVGEVPHQPECYIFPRRQFGKSKVVSRAFQGSLFGTFWVIFSCMFQCLTCISLKWIWCLWSHQKQSYRGNFLGGACPQTPLDYGVLCTPSLIPYVNLARQDFSCFLQPCITTFWCKILLLRNWVK